MLDAGDPDTLKSMGNVVALYEIQGRYAEAETVFLAAIELRQDAQGEEHLNTLGSTTNLGHLYNSMELFDLLLAPAEKTDASAAVLNDAARTLLTHDIVDFRDPERARGFAERACALDEETGSVQSWGNLDTLALHQTGDTAAAIETQRRALALMPPGATPELVEHLAEYEAALMDR